jgi:hypothetical protein
MSRALVSFAIALAGCTWDVDVRDGYFRCPDDRCPSGQACVAGRCEPIPADAGTSPAWWDPAFAVRRQLRIHNSADETAAAGLPVFVEADATSLGIATMNEARLVDHDDGGAVQLPLAVIFDNQRGVVWFRLARDIRPHEVDDAMWLYTSNPAAQPHGAASDTVWELVDHFYTNNLSSTWQATGPVTIADSVLTLSPGSKLRSVEQFGPGHAFDVTARITNWSPGMTLGFHRQTDFLDEPPLVRWAYRAAGLTPEVDVAGSEPWSGPATSGDPYRVEIGVERHVDEASFRHHFLVAESHTLTASFDDPMQVRLDNAGSTPFTIFSMRVRRSMSPLPETTILGMPETQ